MRQKIPIRRPNPTKSQTGDNWAAHKPELKEDFNGCCGYCDSWDGFRHTYYEVDHFIPKDFFKNLGNIGLAQYSNLVYSCKFCNNNKRAHWPSNREDIHHENNKGFVDPCNADYDNHFYRTEDGGIMWKTELGKWMFKEAFKFDERQNSIKILYTLNQLRLLIDGLLLVLNNYEESSEDYTKIKVKLGDYALKYYMYHKELINYYG